MTWVLAVVLWALPWGADGAAHLQSFADIAEDALPGVVNIRTTSYIRGKEEWLDPYQFFLHGMVPQARSTTSLGSGVIIDGRGNIVTNHHVIAGASVIEILFSDSKRKVRASVKGSDPKTDLAVLSLGTPEGRPLDLGDSDSLRIGDVVLAIGNPFGFSHTVTSGIISAKGRVLGTGPYDNFLQTDAAIHPGNSGGPLIDTRGRVIGINTAVSSKGAGIGFAIPINLAKAVVRDLLRHGKVIRPWMGVVGKNILSRDDVESGADPVGVYGVIVANLIVDGPAHKAGLAIGDLIVGIGDEKVLDLNHLQKMLSDQAPSDRVRLKIFRRGSSFKQLVVTLEEIPKHQDLPDEKDLF